jgi:predicted Zn-dependent protease
MPLEPITWVDDGVLRNLYYSRFWAEKQGAEPTGTPGSLRMSGEDNSLEDLIRGTRRGVLVTRLWYIRNIDPRTILYTGLTRDGNFLIEDGQIVHPVNNFRWNDSPLFAFSKLEAMSRPVRVRANREVPAVRVEEFTFSSVSEAV